MCGRVCVFFKFLKPISISNHLSVVPVKKNTRYLFPCTYFYCTLQWAYSPLLLGDLKCVKVNNRIICILVFLYEVQNSLCSSQEFYYFSLCKYIFIRFLHRVHKPRERKLTCTLTLNWLLQIFWSPVSSKVFCY